MSTYGLTRAQMIAQVLANLGDASDRAGLTANLEDNWMPLVMRRLSNARQWPDKETTYQETLSESTNSFSVDTYLRKLIQVRFDDGGNSKVIPIVSPTSFDRTEHAIIEDDQRAEPQKCALYGDTLYFSPVADDDYLVSYRYQQDILKLDEDGDKCGVDGVDDIIIANLTAYACRQLGRPEKAAWWEGQGKQLLEGHDSDMGGAPPLMRPYRVGRRITTEEDRCLI